MSGVALGQLLRHQGPQGALGLAGNRFPIQTVTLSFSTEDGLREFAVPQGEVCLLRRHEVLADAEGRGLVLPNPPVQDLLLTRLGVEEPCSPLLDERNGRRPVLRADVEGGGSIRFFHQTVHFLIFLYESSAAVGVFSFVSRRDDSLSV